jgi:dienelactone hydrolase
MDGPVHGDRRGKPGASGVPLLDFAARWSSDAALTDHAVEDWITVLDAIHPEVGTTVPVGYWGLSMGTILGLPFVASEPRVAAAVLGLMGATGPTQDRILRDAATLTIPVFFVLQWDDQLFPRTTALALFDALGTSNKMLVANPGPHAGVPARTFAASADFLADCLLGGV